MNMMKCPKCGKFVRGQMNFCPMCGEKMEDVLFAQTEKVKDKKKWYLTIGAIAASVFIVVLCMFLTKGNKLKGNDLEAYNLVMEVCKKAYDPEDVSVISGTVVGEGEDAMGSLTVQDGYTVYHVLVYYEDGEPVCMDGEDSYRYGESYREMYEKTDSFNADAVNRALKNYWAKNKK